MQADILMVGAGLSGAVAGRALAEAGHRVTIADSRPHIAGNCHTERCPETGVLVHVYGPHIFHTERTEVWDYVNRFARFRPYRHQVRTTLGGKVFAMPINLLTINQFFGLALRPDEAIAFIEKQTERGTGEPANFEEQALAMMGRPLYEAFFKGYTEKQWGCPATDLPAHILKRLPMRFNYDDNYFAHPFQGMPEEGYSEMVARILDHERITLQLGRHVSPDEGRAYAAQGHVFWSGPLDAWFGHDAGHLGYRTLDFERFTARGDWQGCAVMNWPEAEMPFTRITEHKHFAPWESHEKSVLYREYSRACGEGDIPYYPIRLAQGKALLAEYVARARREAGVTFMGRLGTYRYIDMDVTIHEALLTARAYLEASRAGRAMQAFVVEPL